MMRLRVVLTKVVTTYLQRKGRIWQRDHTPQRSTCVGRQDEDQLRFDGA